MGTWTPSGPISDAALIDGHLYVACEAAGLQVLDPADLSAVSSFVPGAAITGVAMSTKGLIAVAADASFYVLDPYSPAAPLTELDWAKHITTPITGRYVTVLGTTGNFLVSGEAGVAAYEFPGTNSRTPELLWLFEELPAAVSGAEGVTFGRVCGNTLSAVFACAQVHAPCGEGTCHLPFLVRLTSDYYTGEFTGATWQPVGEDETDARPTSVTYCDYGLLIGLTRTTGDASALFHRTADLAPIRSLTLDGSDAGFAELQNKWLIVAAGSGGLQTYSVPSLLETNSIAAFFTIVDPSFYSYSCNAGPSFQAFMTSSCMGEICSWESRIYDVRAPLHPVQVYSAVGTSEVNGETHSQSYGGAYEDFLYLVDFWNYGYYFVYEKNFLRAGTADKMRVPDDTVGWGGRQAPSGDGHFLWLLDSDCLLRSADLASFPTLDYVGALQLDAGTPVSGLWVGPERAFLFREDPVTGHELVVLGLDDPANPVQRGVLSLPGKPNAVHGRGDRVLFQYDTQLVAIDLSDPLVPVQTDSYALDSSLLGLADGKESLLVLVESARARILDWSEAGDLTFVSEFAPQTYFRPGAAISGPLAYLAESTDEIHLVDLSDPYSPLHAGSAETQNFNLPINNLFVTAGYLVAPGEVYPLDCSDPTFGASTVLDETLPGASSLLLARPCPNPFNPQTRVAWRVTKTGPVEVAVYDLAGRRVKSLFSGTMEPGSRSTIWYGDDEVGRGMPSGVYFFRAEFEGRTRTQKAVLLR